MSVGGRPRAFNTVEEFQEGIDNYFIYCDENSKPYTVLGLAIYLDISRDTLNEYSRKEGYSDTFKKAREKIESYAENLLFESKNPAGIIFNLKNNFKWTDKIETENINHNINQDVTGLSDSELDAELEKYK